MPDVYEIRSKGTIGGNGWPRGRRRIYTQRRSLERIAKLDTTAEERRYQVSVIGITGKNQGVFYAGPYRSPE